MSVRGRGPKIPASDLPTAPMLHLASCAYLVEHGQEVALASYDRGMVAVARAMEIPLFELEGSQTAARRAGEMK